MAGNDTIRDENRKRPWYREFYVWMMIFFPAVTVVGGVIMLVIATRTFDGLVVDDYYKRGMQINRDLARDRKSYDYGLEGRLAIDAEAALIRIELKAAQRVPIPDTLRVGFFHATRQGLDLELQMHRRTAFAYTAPLPPLPPGRWNIQVEANDWRLVGSLTAPTSSTALLASGADG